MANSKKTKSKSHLIGSWSFFIGLLLAVILGLGFAGKYQVPLLWTVFLLGVVVGLINITHDETAAFLTSGTVLVLLSFLGVQVGIFDAIAPVIGSVLRGILTLFVPATIIVALKATFALAER